MSVVVTGGMGFIGSNFISKLLEHCDDKIVNVDLLSYASCIENLSYAEEYDHYDFYRVDISNKSKMNSIINEYQPHTVVHFAAETHVDRSIIGPEIFMKSNIFGTFNLIEVLLSYWQNLDLKRREEFRFINISTDEVYGSLADGAPPFTETSRYLPNSPYSASKASADLLVRSYNSTYGFPAITTNCSNNYGPRQSKDKLIPKIISNAINNLKIPIYGDGLQVRDWLYVADHCDAVLAVIKHGIIGETYNIGGQCEMTNIEVVTSITNMLDDVAPLKNGGSYQSLIDFVDDRPGHDQRYAVDIQKISGELGWLPKISFEVGLRKTIDWYLNQPSKIKS